MPDPAHEYRPPRARSLAVFLAAAGLALATQAAAQDTPPRAVTGSVVDARTGEPSEGAVVVLEPAAGARTGPDRATSAIRAGRRLRRRPRPVAEFAGRPLLRDPRDRPHASRRFIQWRKP
jgi:hypothetical protein